MDFCSKYGYHYGFDGSDSESMSDEEVEEKQASSEPVAKRTKKIRKADANIIAVKFDQLVLPNEMFAGDPIKCKTCEAVMSKYSKANIETSDDKTVWTCEFCFEENDLSKMLKNLDEIPNHDDVTFLLEPAAAKTDEPKTSNAKNASSDDSYFTFCIDVSGSMDERIAIKNKDSLEYEQTAMSRLQGVKVAAVENLSKLKEEDENKRVSLVTFSNTVRFYGDGTEMRNNEPLLKIGDRGGYRAFAGRRSIAENQEDSVDILANKEKLIALAKNQQGNLKSIKETYANLEQRVKSLKTEGSTALGPALVFSIGFSCKKLGSQVILCTDGCANIGMGSVENGDQDEAEKFYEDLADYAKNNGVTVNVISMEGTDCKLALLGKVADTSNGTLSIVNPMNLSEQFKSIIENRIVATSVKAKLIVNHKYLYIRDDQLEEKESEILEKGDEAKESLNEARKSVSIKDIGNANLDTEITFEYGIRKLKGEEPKNAFKELAFQLQISYTTVEGAKATRVYTKVQEFTTDRQKAEQNLISDELLFVNSAQKMSGFVMSSNSRGAKRKQYATENFRMRNNMSSSDLYIKQARLVRTMRNDVSANMLNDEEAAELFSGKKVNRKQFKK
jgi:RNase P subunit RPR2